MIVIALALGMKALMPAGTMLAASSSKTLVIALCAPVSGGKVTHVTVPMDEGGGGQPDGAQQADHCAFASLGTAGLGGADPFVLALALAFILLLGLAPLRRLPYAAALYLRPPLRGPPATA